MECSNCGLSLEDGCNCWCEDCGLLQSDCICEPESKFREQQGRLRLVCMYRDKQKVLDHIKTHKFLSLVGTYEKNLGYHKWSHIIIDTIKPLDYQFVENFQLVVDGCLGAFENYETKFD